MVRSRIQSVIWFVFVVSLYIFSDSYFALFLVVASVVLFLFLWLSTQLLKNRIQFSINSSKSTNKNVASTCCIEAINKSYLPVAKVKGILSMKNCVTGEERKQELFFSMNGKGNERVSFDIESEFCGEIQLNLERVDCYDLLGLFSQTSYPAVSTNVVVIPDTFFIDVSLLEHTLDSEESAIDSIGQKGFGDSDIVSMKEYTPGDNVKNIHWKLSSKLDELIVKELSTSTEHSILVLLETAISEGSDEDSPKVSDAMIEVFVSISKSLIENDEIHSIGWFDHEIEELRLEGIHSTDQLTHLLNELLTTEKKTQPDSSMNYYFNHTGRAAFSQIVYITSQQSEKFIDERENESFVTHLVCRELGNEGKTSGVIFTPESMEEDLRQLIS